MLKKLISLWTTAILFVMLATTNIFACACCAEKGHYSIRTSKPGSYEMNLLKDIKFADTTLYTDAGYPDSIRGINPLGDAYSVEASLSDKDWMFKFKDNKEKTGQLNLQKPISMVSYMVDMHESEDSKVSDVTLYKEWRFKYLVNSGTGIFSKGINKKTSYFFVLQGRGNVCTNPEDFTHWRLEVDGKNAKYAFFGKLNK